jgi:glycosyltransferase involved in cell wall biosynthesis
MKAPRTKFGENLLIPENDEQQPEVSIVIPAMNEALTIGEFIDWCKEGFRKADVRGEILIISSSTDKTSAIALSKGARVLETPCRGLGRAYIDSIPYIRGRYCILGDADLTYDFRDIKPFVDKFREGHEYIMGSRFRGYIEKGAMPALHKYLGTPVTTWILNMIYSSKFSDIHCGMRGITKNALIRINLRSQSWEYASEMVIKAVHMKLKISEVPIRFYKDRDGRLSHLKRGGWLSPWKAAWINLKAMFIYGADFFLLRPGLVLLTIGLLLTIPISLGPITLGKITFSIFWMLLGLTFSTLGFQLAYLGILAKLLFDYSGQKQVRIKRFFSYNRSVAISAILFLLGVSLIFPFISNYVESDFVLNIIPKSAYMAITGLEMLIFSFINFAFTLLFHGLMISKETNKK